MVEETVPSRYDRPAVAENYIGGDLSSFDNVLFLGTKKYHLIELSKYMLPWRLFESIDGAARGK